MSRLAVVLMNLGGPDSPESVRPFLYNLFADPAIIGLPAPFRQMLAWFVSKRRDKTARAIYAHLGGSSPLLAQTEAQAAALQLVLSSILQEDVRTFIAMRYWHPMSRETVARIAEWQPDRIVLLPLYPQYSSTSTASAVTAWLTAAQKGNLLVPTQAVCCYPTQLQMIAAHVDLITQVLERPAGFTSGQRPRILFSAHGLPQRIVDRGDPYPNHVELTARAIMNQLDDRKPGLDWAICYQSRVGPLAWIGPSTDAEIRRAGAEGRDLIVVPIAFVSEHSETLVELDIEYAHLAKQSGVPHYLRVPALASHPEFITGLAQLVRETTASQSFLRPDGGQRICSATCVGCPISGVTP